MVLISAAHVVDEAQCRRLYYGPSNVMARTPAVILAASPMPPSDAREDDPTDAGVWLVEPDVAQGLRSTETLHLSDLDASGAVPAVHEGHDRFVPLGYPHSRQPRQLRGEELDVREMRFLTEAHRLADYVAIGRQRASHLFVS